MSEYRYHNTPARLDAWRKCSYRKPEEKLPPGYFGALSPASVNREPMDKATGKPRTPTFNYGDGLGGRTERPFRFVGFADEVKEARIRHTGWYGDDEATGFDMYRGVVFQIPARGGNTLYLAGTEWGEQGARGSFETGGGWIEIGRGDVYESKEDAARAADSIAERAAEAEREYQLEESERIRAEEEEAEEAREREEEEHATATATALESVLKLAGEVCNATGEPGTVSEPMRQLIGQLEDALHEYDSLTAETSDTE